MTHVDGVRLAEIIEEFLKETQSPCTSRSVCIGVVDGRQVQLRVVNVDNEDDDDEVMAVNKKWKCVTGGR